MFDIKMYYSLVSVQSNIGMLSTRFSINEIRNIKMFYRLKQCKAILECLAPGSIKKDKEIFV